MGDIHNIKVTLANTTLASGVCRYTTSELAVDRIYTYSTDYNLPECVLRVCIPMCHDCLADKYECKYEKIEIIAGKIEV